MRRSDASPAADARARTGSDPGASLAQALRYVRAWASRTVVVKYGGSIMDGEPADTLAEDLVLLQGAGVRPVLVHGGGPEITRMLDRLGKPSRFVNGLRVTDQETMDVVEMVLAGRANKALVARLAAAGGRAVGLSGKDGGLLRARPLAGPEDLGLVGEVEEVDPTVVRVLAEHGFIPVVASVGWGRDGRTYNLNADHAAAALAGALGAGKFIVLTDVPGILTGQPPQAEVLSTATAAQVRALVAEGVISRGMIPKVEACLTALEAGVPSAHIIDGRQPHGLLVELFTEQGVGTMITL
ncbi:MAG: acetylglutamate kinase [Armatimonadota bacterium]|nr:acetylglutamate kinase [Armatimonadota bacterium]MDR7561568.1 acetylglutamate kinase [Armatimonadota bacterium]MDR7588388.1 acetylglutamate kinase [Armatimonadota bacterium]MDR7612541.1 acetylglutamate kinase [Armatimonadota bacterium]